MTSLTNDVPRIRRALTEDLPQLMHYVEREWKSGHILARDAEFFRYEYQSGKSLNFIISENSCGAINGGLLLLGATELHTQDLWKSERALACAKLFGFGQLRDALFACEHAAVRGEVAGLSLQAAVDAHS